MLPAVACWTRQSPVPSAIGQFFQSLVTALEVFTRVISAQLPQGETQFQ